MTTKSVCHSYIPARQLKPLVMSAQDAADTAALAQIGIGWPDKTLAQMAGHFAADDAQGLFSTASIGTPIQFLQAWMPGFVRGITAVRKIDELIGIGTYGKWHDAEVVQGVLEPTGNAVPYDDYAPVPLGSWNTNFERRSVVRFEQGIKVGMLEDARAAEIKLNNAAEKRNAATTALEIQRNVIGFSGYNSGNNRTYGFLNDPALPAYVNVPAGASASTLWSGKTFLEILADIRTAVATLITQSQGVVDPNSQDTTLALGTASIAYLSVVNVQGTQSVQEWISKTFPLMRVVSAPQLNAANGSANVFYLFAESVDDGASDDSRVFAQVVPAKFMALGVGKDAKSYTEDYTNATAGVMCKRPYAVTRFSGI